MNRKSFLVATAVMVATIVVQACSSATSSTAPSTEPSSGAPSAAAESPSAPAAPVTLTLWHNYGVEANAKVTDALAKAYMAANPNVTIQLVAQPADNYFALLKTAARDSEVERVLINPAIKKALCRDVKDDRSWLHKMRPVLGHNYHFHVRIGCPPDSTGCKSQSPAPNDEGCGMDLDWWFKPVPRQLLIKPGKSKPILMSALPPACRQVLLAE